MWQSGLELSDLHASLVPPQTRTMPMGLAHSSRHRLFLKNLPQCGPLEVQPFCSAALSRSLYVAESSAAASQARLDARQLPAPAAVRRSAEWAQRELGIVRYHRRSDGGSGGQDARHRYRKRHKIMAMRHCG